MSTPQTLASHVEVERKFLPTALLEAQLDGKACGLEHRRQSEGLAAVDALRMRPLHFFRLPDMQIRDTYFDLKDVLVGKGIWVRLRTTEAVRSNRFPVVVEGNRSTDWETKVRLGGDYTNSQFTELQGKQEVQSLIAQHLPSAVETDLEVIADLDTHRKSWIVRDDSSTANCHGEIQIVLDEATIPESAIPEDSATTVEPFKYQVGEVEMTRYVVGTDQQELEEAKRQAADDMQGELDEFMMHHSVLFSTTPKPKGKLSASFEWKKGQKPLAL